MLPPPGARVLIAMSGGVDSAAAAALLVERGCDCLGATMRLVPEHPEKSVFEPCCGLEAVNDARRVCEALGIPHHVFHLVERFEDEIIAYFLDEYQAGRTPNPCVRCNRLIKFGALYEQADAIGADVVAMGHFARVEPRDERLALRRGADPGKDQSYVLAALTQPQLQRACFPVGGMTKAEVRAYARERSLPTASKAESQEICFVADRDYALVVEQRRGPSAPGLILDTGGAVLGRHQGLIHYTIGQRRGLGIAAPRPLYVVRLDLARNAVVVGYDEDTYCGAFTTGPLEWGGMAPQQEAFECHVQLRSRHRAAPATVVPREGGTEVRLHEPQRSVTPGQWAVCYDGEYVVAAGVIQDFQPLPPRE